MSDLEGHTFGRRLKAAREDLGLSQERLAEAIGVVRRTLAHYEAGTKSPEFSKLPAIAAATGKPLAWFFQDEAPTPAPAAQPPPPPDAHALLAQIVAAQVRAEERQAEMLAAQAEMSQALMALAHERLESRAEAARTSARLTQIEEALRALLETPEGGCQGQARCTG